jgi:hypothetical protein
MQIEVSCTTADEDLLNTVMKPDSKSKTLENESSHKATVREKISWAKPANMYSTLLMFSKS